MDKALWKVISLCLVLLFCELCNALPINLENTAADYHTQLLTGLVGVLLTVCSIVFIAGCLCCQRSNGFKEFRDSPVTTSTASNLDHGHVNPIAANEFTIFTPLSPGHQNNNAFLANEQIFVQNEHNQGNADIASWFDRSEKDFPRARLKYIKEIGRGWFGKVVEGAAQDPTDPQKWTPVSVRILEASASSRERFAFLHDALIYRDSGHPNVLRLFGRCLDTIPLLLLQEFCPNGDLKKHLQQTTADKLLSTEYPLVWCCQLTSALKHLHEKNLTHPDLAARNCQITSDLRLKLGDYGLSVSNYPSDYYEGAPGVPIRWCAPESVGYTNTTIEPRRQTKEANVWSLGVTMWEVCECGERPYANLSDDDVIVQVLETQSVRLSRPKVEVLYTDYLYRLMQLCWTINESRPTVSQLDLMLADLLQVYKNTNTPHTSILDFDQRWLALKPNNPAPNRGSLTNLLEVGAEPRFAPDSPTHSPPASSGSETEDENWKAKVERGLYSEKVRQKSRSVADLMVLTHIEQSESETDTSLPSLDFVRLQKRCNPESVSFSSEGNLLNVEDEFGEALKRMQEERRDSLLFVPESGTNRKSESKLLKELNSGGEIQPVQQVYNVFNVTIDKLSPIHVRKLNEIICLGEKSSFQVPKLADIVQNQLELVNSSIFGSILPLGGDSVRNDEIFDSLDSLNSTKIDYDNLDLIVSNERGNLVENAIDLELNKIVDKIETCNEVKGEEEPKLYQVPKLFDLIQSNDDLMDYIIAKYENEMSLDRNDETFDSLESLKSLKSNSGESKIDFDLGPNHSNVKALNLHAEPCNAETSGVELTKLYSLETWDNFLGQSLDNNQNEEQQQTHMFDDDFSNEPKSLLFIEQNGDLSDGEANDRTYTLEAEADGKEGWFLHPQDGDEVDEFTSLPGTSSDTYLGFNMDDEIMAAIRNELITKLPQAQSGTSTAPENEEEWETTDRNEVFLRYNVYNTLLSPIPEELLEEDLSNENTPRQPASDDDSDWSDNCKREELDQCAHPNFLHRHTPSQESCCSNDTLFNLEELAASEADPASSASPKCDAQAPLAFFPTAEIGKTCSTRPANEAQADLLRSGRQVAPLPSPEDHPWRRLPASLLSYSAGRESSGGLMVEKVDELDEQDLYNEADYVNLIERENRKNSNEGIEEFENGVYETHSPNLIIDENFGVLADIRFSGPSDSQLMTTSFSESNDLNEDEQWDSGSDTRSSSSGEFIWKEGEHEEYLKVLRAPAPASDRSSSGSDSECADGAEFVPSAWDQFATPAKSALRSPVASLARRARAVCFKKQKYHCVYEYPREPEGETPRAAGAWLPPASEFFPGAPPAPAPPPADLGGWRHARDRLRLDLPAGPAAFAVGEAKAALSRFLVQQVEIPTVGGVDVGNVSFEAIPYRAKGGDERQKIEVVRGEASLLDSADEDSGIESSTVERKLTGAVVE